MDSQGWTYDGDGDRVALYDSGLFAIQRDALVTTSTQPDFRLKCYIVFPILL